MMASDHYVATSKFGLNFNRPEVGGEEGHGLKRLKFADRNYLRVFTYRGDWYGFAQRGFFLKPADPEFLWDAPEGWNSSDPLWVSAASSPIEDDLVANGLAGDHLPNGGLGSAPRVCAGDRGWRDAGGVLQPEMGGAGIYYAFDCGFERGRLADVADELSPRRYGSR